MAATAETTFRRFACEKLTQLCERIEECLLQLNEEQVWERSGEHMNSVGNLVLHLCGNVRQWIGYGVAGRADVRDRDSEFAAREGLTPTLLRARLAAGVQEAVSQIEALPDDQLLNPTSVQVYTLTKLEAIFHVVEHFSMHAGQIILLTKAFTGNGLEFYKFLEGKPGSPGDGTP